MTLGKLVPHEWDVVDRCRVCGAKKEWRIGRLGTCSSILVNLEKYRSKRDSAKEAEKRRIYRSRGK